MHDSHAEVSRLLQRLKVLESLRRAAGLGEAQRSEYRGILRTLRAFDHAPMPDPTARSGLPVGDDEVANDDEFAKDTAIAGEALVSADILDPARVLDSRGRSIEASIAPREPFRRGPRLSEADASVVDSSLNSESVEDTGLGDALKTRLPEVLRSDGGSLFAGTKDAEDAGPQIDAEWFIRVLLPLVGSELEGTEISFCIAFGAVPGQGDQGLGLVASRDDLASNEEIRRRFGLPDNWPGSWKDLGERRMLEFLRVAVVPEAWKGSGGSVAFFESPEGGFAGLYRVTRHVGQGDEPLCKLTHDPRWVGVLVKPVAAVRFYRSEKYVAQVIRLRDGLGWSIRRVDQAVEMASKVLGPLASRMPRGMLDVLVETALEMSESRKGGALCVVERDELVKKWQEPGGNIVRSRREVDGGPATGRGDWLMRRLASDGAVVINTLGVAQASGVYFNIGGGRREGARRLCSEQPDCGMIVVSQDGPIYFGRRQTWAELDLKRYGAR